MSSNDTLKSYSNKSKAKRGLQTFGKFTDEQMEHALVLGLLFQRGDDGRWTFDTDNVPDVVAKLAEPAKAAPSVISTEDLPDTGSDNASAPSPSMDPAPAAPQPEPAAPQPDAQDEQGTPQAPAVFGGIANNLQSAPQTPTAAPAAPRAQSRSTYTIEKNRPEQNGIKRPSVGGLCRAVWDACDELRAQKGGAVPEAGDIRTLADNKGWNKNNAMIEFYQWRKYNGIVGRTPKAAPAPAPVNNAPQPAPEPASEAPASTPAPEPAAA